MKKFKKLKLYGSIIFHRKIWLTMKIIIFLLALNIVQLSANVFSQNTALIIEGKNLTITQVIEEIERQTDYRFIYRDNFLNAAETVNLAVETENVESVLPGLLEQLNLNYILFENNLIVITPQDSGLKQGTKITGKVTNANGDPLPGVNVVVQGTITGAVTNLDGEYTISVPNDNAVLEFSYVGYLTEEFPVEGKSTINISLVEDIQALDEVVVVGYGTVKKSDLTGSVASVKAEDIERVPVTGVDQALQGRAAGVQVTKNFSQPGGDISIRVRGITSIQGNTSPLYVIDGLVGGNINTVNPTDIESIEILKDASSTSIYGARGANGVVLVTTKSGSKGTNNITFNSYYGWQKVYNKLDLLNAREFAEISNKINVALGNDPLFDLSNVPNNTDWQDELYRTAPMQNYNLSAAGGKEELNYFISGSYIQQQGIVPNTNYDRYNLRLNLDSKINDRVQVGTRIGFSRYQRDRLQNEYDSDDHGPISAAIQLAPTLSPYDENGNLLPEAELDEVAIPNPLHFQKYYTDFNYANDIAGTTFANIKISEGLTFKPSINYQLGMWRQNRYKPSNVYDFNLGYRNEADVSTNNTYSWHTDLILNYNKSFNVHTLNLLGGFIATQNGGESINSLVQDFAIDVFEYNLLSAGANIQNVNSGKWEKQELAYIGRVNYSYKSKYLATLNGRYDGSSIFGEDKKWGFFPSASVAWRLSEEPFIQNLGLFHNLKIRGGYGISGSEALGAYASLAKVRSGSSTGYNLGTETVVGFIPSALAVPDLQWEETAQLNIGLDASFFGGRLGIVADYYDKETTKLFLDVPLPRTSGVESITKNTGSLNNSGFEISLNTVIFDGTFKWNSDLNFAYQEMEITDLGSEEEIIHGRVGGNIKLGNIHIMSLGQPLGAFYGFATDGIWQESELVGVETPPTQFGNEVEPGAVKYIDNNNDGNINDDDRQILGYGLPDFFGGWNNTFAYKAFDASVFMQYTMGNDILNVNRWRLMSVNSVDRNKLSDIKDHWTPDNQSNTVPRLGYQEPKVVSDRLLENGSFLRMRELTLGYTLPSNLTSSIRITRLRIYGTITNVFTITEYTGYTPEVNNYGSSLDRFNVDNGSYPSYRTFFIGVNLGF